MFITVGHSQLSETEFLDLLQEAGITQVVDVRKLPGSRAYPHTNEERLRESLPAQEITYTHCAGLTGRRPKSHEVDPEINGMWRNQSFHNYADYALSDEFHSALERLRTLEGTVAVMCSEAVWWRCHRRIIADYLLSYDEEVAHLFPEGKLQSAALTPGAVARPGRVTYPVSPSPSTK